jgi:hypothetical protein
MSDASTDDTRVPSMTLAAWGDLGEDEPGELVDGHLVEDEHASRPVARGARFRLRQDRRFPGEVQPWQRR